MAEKKYQVFISSTYEDLKHERSEVSQAVLDLGHIPAGMELFPASDTDQLDYIKRVIDECDYYVLILAGRYGSEDAEGVGYTQREYEYAKATGKVVLAFLHSQPDKIELGKTDKEPSKAAKLDAFRKEAATGRLIKHFQDAATLRAVATTTLSLAFRQSPQVGWVRADTVPDRATLTDVLTLREENERLRQQLENLRKEREPLFADAADLSASVRQRYNIGNFYEGITRVGGVQVSFAEWLTMVAPALLHGSALDPIIEALKVGLQERHGIDGIHSLHQSDVHAALLHLVATGHVRLMDAASKPYQLTSRGVGFWIEHNYVRGGISSSEGNISP